MRLLASCLVCSLALAPTVFAQSGTSRYLYMSTPDGAQELGRAEGAGILVFDIDDDHRLVRRIDIPIFAEGLRGFAGNLETHSVVYSTTNRRLGAFNLETEQKIWEQTYDAGCDRSSITLDGSKIYAPTGWWYKGDDSGMLVVDASNGDLIDRIEVGPAAHNSIVSLDGDRLYLGTDTMLSIFDTKTDELVGQIRDVGERGVFPYTLTRDESTAYVCLGAHVGFDVIDLKRLERTHRVFAGDEKIAHRTHGVALNPDETELWISDQEGQKLFIFDATETPPAQTGRVELSQGGHGWVAFSLDGRYAWSHAPDIFDARTKERIGAFRDEQGRPVSGSKYLEIHFRDGKVVAMGHEFGLGRKKGST